MPPRDATAAPVDAEHGTLYVAVEIGRNSWVIGIKSPVSEKTRTARGGGRSSRRRDFSQRWPAP